VVVVLIGLAIGGGLGLSSGLAVGYGRASAFIVTLAMGSIAAGLELVVQGRISGGSTTIQWIDIPNSLRALVNTSVFGIQLAVFVLILVAAVVGAVLVLTPWGRHVHAIGGNEIAALLAGVPVRRVKVTAFVVAGVLAAAAGIFFVAGQGYYPNALTGFLLPAYAAAFFGGAAVARRGFSVPATLFGTLYLQTLANGLLVMNEPQWVTSLVQGVVLFVTVLLARAGSKN
jgi:ribose/xylose/arabinose/galactoside ABC-type transport system permease subunit